MTDKPPTDKQRLDKLQRLLDRRKYTGRCVLRWSNSGRGMRLHETSDRPGHESVREAIDAFEEGE